MPTPSEIQTCIDNLSASSEAIDFTLLATETSNANTGISFTVATVDDLPDLETSNIGAGQIVFVESVGVPVVSASNEWSGLDGRLLRKDFDEKTIFSWGLNKFGQLGDETITTRNSPVREVCFSADWCQVSVGVYHTAAVKMSGQLWVWGSNANGRLGDGTTVSKCFPVREFCSDTNWHQVSVGQGASESSNPSLYCNSGGHVAAIKTSGELWSWGSGTCGRLGDGTTTGRCSPVREFCSATDWCQVSAGAIHTAAIKTSGQLWTWGSGVCFRLGTGTTTTRCSPVREFCSATNWCQVSSGSFHTAAVKTSGELWAWGRAQFGRLGDGTFTDRCSPVRERCSATDWCQVSASNAHTAAIKTSGELWAWGCNFYGRLGDGTTTTRSSPVREICSATDWCQVSSGGFHTAAVKTSGQLWVWGGADCGKLGDGTSTIRCSPVREFCSATDWCQASAGHQHTAAIRIIA